MTRSKMVIVVLCLLLWTGLSQAAPIAGTAGSTQWQEGPNAEGFYYIATADYEAFDGLDASDPLGVTPGKTQYAYILSYVEGNEFIGRFDVESTNGVPLLDAATSTTGTVDGITAGDIDSSLYGITTLESGNPVARFLFQDEGDSIFGLTGARSTILVYTASNTYSVDTVLAQITNSSLSAAAEVVGPTVCVATIAGNVFCLSCGPTGQITPMEGININVIKDGNQVATAVTGASGQFQVAGLSEGKYTVAVAESNQYAPCSVSSLDVNVVCNSTAPVSFCVCPQACTQQICVQTVCDQNGTAVPAPHTYIGINGPQICKWTNTGLDGTKCFSGAKIVPGHYKVKVMAPKGYAVSGSDTQEFDLAQCENKSLVFNVCPIPPCTQTECVNVIAIGTDGNSFPVPNVNVCVACSAPDRKCGKTDATGKVCFDLKPGHHTATITIPTGYRLNDGSSTIAFALAKCESNSVQFTLSQIPYGPCAKMPDYWKSHSSNWPVNSMWVGACMLDKTSLLNILSGKMANGTRAPCNDITMTMAQNLIAVKLSIAAGTDVADIAPAVVASDEFFLYDYPPGSKPQGKGADLARKLNNQLVDYLRDCDYCQQ